MLSNKWKGKKLYHYTSFSVLDGILSKGELWLCNVKAMNDYKEMLHYMDCLENAVCKGLSNQQKAEAHTLFAKQMEKLKDSPVYVSSFSILHDDAAQWERYASAGMGVCLTFNAELLENICRRHAVLQKIFYTINANRSKHTILIRDYILTGTVDKSEWGSIDGIFENSWAASSAYKHSSFKSEKEVRIVSLPFSLKYFLGEPHYKAEVWGIREYYTLNLKENPDIKIEDLITEVTIGPKSNATEDTVEKYLANLNESFSKIKVIRSQCPLR